MLAQTFLLVPRHRPELQSQLRDVVISAILPMKRSLLLENKDPICKKKSRQSEEEFCRMIQSLIERGSGDGAQLLLEGYIGGEERVIGDGEDEKEEGSERGDEDTIHDEVDDETFKAICEWSDVDDS
jgi:hypothetical protein